jgi:Ca2+-binding RTX toxin-like protein
MADITGSDLNDSLAGTAANDLIRGLGGDDTLVGGGGSDTILGGAGDDEITVGAGNDSIDGGDGWDELHYESAATAISVNFGTGLVTGGSGTDTISGIEVIFGTAFNDTVIGDAGDNAFVGGAGNDSFDGGAGSDTVGYIGAASAVNVNLGTGVVTGGAGNDTLVGIEGVYGSNFNDTLIGTAGDNWFAGSLGNDSITGGGGLDFLSYEEATGGVTVDLGAGTASGADGNDSFSGIEGVDGSWFNDSLIGGAGGDFLFGDRGNDTMLGNGGDDTMTGDAGIDWFIGGAGADFYDGGADNDVVFFEDGSQGAVIDLLNGFVDNDGFGNIEFVTNVENVHGTQFGDQIQLSLNGYVFARAGNDTLTGASGNNLFFGGSGNDVIDGGAGFDVVNYLDAGGDSAGASASGVTVNLATGTATDNWGGTDTLSGIENVTGSAAADTLTGDALSNSLDGGSGNDSLYGGDGEDTLRGGAGNDLLNGQGNVNGTTFDYADYRDATGALTANLATGTATAAGVGTDTLVAIEGLFGTEYNDSMTGGATADVFFGNLGNDTIDGGADFDFVGYNQVPLASGVNVNLATGIVTGGAGNDLLSNIENVGGSELADTLTGNAGNNFLRGRGGNDTIDGGAGNDRAAYDRANGAVQVSLLTNTSSGADGVDTLIGIENLRGGNFGDTLTGNDSANDIQGRGGVDFIVGNGGNDSLFGEDGDDSISGDAGADFIRGGSGNDTMDGGLVFDLVNLDDGNSLSYSDAPGGIVLDAEAGTASDGFGSTDQFTSFQFYGGSAFNDSMTGSSNGFEQFEGGLGDDTIVGGVIDDPHFSDSNRASYQNASGSVTVNLAAGTATGAAGNDTLVNINFARGSAFNDTLIGSNRTDVTESFEGRAGSDSIDGAGGIDQIRFAAASSGVNVNLVTGTASDGDGGTDTFTNIEGVRGSAFNDTLTGGNAVNGTTAREGFEAFQGDAGNDQIDGGQGYDRADYNNSIAGVNVTLGGTGAGTASDGYGTTDTLLNIEGVRGSSFDDTLTGSNSGVFESFEGREGFDLIDGNGGIDRADYSGSRAGVNISLLNGGGSDGYGMADTLIDIEDVRGSINFGDTIVGSAAANLLEGQGGNDSLDGSSGNDTLDGGSGDDTVNGNAGTDTASYASAGSGVIVSLAIAGVQATGGGGSDTLVSIENLLGSQHNDSLTGNAAANTLDGGAGADNMTGGDGNDTYEVDNAGDQVVEASAAGGTDLVNASVTHTLATNVENLRLTATGAINGTGNGSTNILYAGAGNNVLDGLGGTDTASYLYAGSGVTVSLAAAGAQATGGSGTDTLVNIENLRGSDFNDTLTGNAGANVLEGGLGNDVLNGSSGFDTASYVSAGAAVTVSLAIAGAQATGGAGSDTLNSIEYLRGSSFNDSLTGNAGVNLIDGGAGNDLIDGGAGVDTAFYATAGAGVTVSLAIAGAQATGGSGSDTLLNIENLTGSAFNDTLTGNAAANILEGGAGNDVLDGGAGVDTVSYAAASAAVTVNLGLAGAQATGGAGSDTLSNLESLRGSNFNDTLTGNAANNTLEGGAGNDVLDGSTGFDYASYVSASSGVTVSLAIAGAQNTVGAGSDTLSNIEYLRGSSFNDSLTGNAGNNIIDGGAGNDVLDGGSGTDTAYYATAAAGVNVNLGIAGAQSTSGSGVDTLLNFENLTGSGFNDTLIGNAGANILTGLAGADTFVFNSTAAADTVSDFVSGVDKLRISQAGIAIGNGNTTIDNAASIAGPGGFATAAELVIVTGNIGGAINATSAAAAIGSATSAYGIGQKVLFAVDNGTGSALYLFTAADANAAVSAAELTLLATLTNSASTTVGDFIFGP